VPRSRDRNRLEQIPKQISEIVDARFAQLGEKSRWSCKAGASPSPTGLLGPGDLKLQIFQIQAVTREFRTISEDTTFSLRAVLSASILLACPSKSLVSG
jgi:hypothetical protein